MNIRWLLLIGLFSGVCTGTNDGTRRSYQFEYQHSAKIEQ
jgi:hypothetical protein